jgi:hypothetical protein
MKRLMKTIKIKTVDGKIKNGYETDLSGEMENKALEYKIIIIPPNKGESCPCMVFAKDGGWIKYQYKEIATFPFINLYEKSYMTQLMKVYEKSRK